MTEFLCVIWKLSIWIYLNTYNSNGICSAKIEACLSLGNLMIVSGVAILEYISRLKPEVY